MRQHLLDAFDATAASQCGFCTPGILMRLVGLGRKGVPSEQQVRTALGAHLCRCTGIQPIVDAALLALDPSAPKAVPRNPDAARLRATLESGTAQDVGAEVMLGSAGFAIDTAPDGCKVAIGTVDGGYVVGDDVDDARRHLMKTQGRNSTIPLRSPVELFALDGAVLKLQTTFVEPAYVEPDSSWCVPGGEPALPFANAGAFGAKRHSRIAGDARQLSEELGAPILVMWPREEVVRRGAKRPPIALSLNADGSGYLRIGRTPGSDPFDQLLEQLASLFPMLEIEVVEVVGPRIGVTHRGAVVAEVLSACAALETPAGAPIEVAAPNGARARVEIEGDGAIHVTVWAGDPLCGATLKSYVTGAVHQALGMVLSEGIAVAEDGSVHDLTIRSFGILAPAATPRIDVELAEDERQALSCGVAVMAATMAAAWRQRGLGSKWPTTREVS
jgi:xanthine dehydrogenase small subunit